MFDIESLPAITKIHSIHPEDLRMVTKPIPSLFKPNLPKNSSKTTHPPLILDVPKPWAREKSSIRFSPHFVCL
jgi:hypothetical protein